MLEEVFFLLDKSFVGPWNGHELLEPERKVSKPRIHIHMKISKCKGAQIHIYKLQLNDEI